MVEKKKGVFSPCTKLDSASMIKCLQALIRDYPSIEFNSMAKDEKYGGFRVLFSEPEDSTVLEKNQLTFDGRAICVYPLTAYLFISNLDHKKTTNLFEHELCDTIRKKYGEILDIVKTDNPDRSKSWLLEIDIPEFRFLEAWHRSIFDGMILSIPGRKEEIILNSWCRQCKLCGHFQHECLSKLKESNWKPEKEAGETDKGEGHVGENRKEKTISSPELTSERTPSKISNFSYEATKKYAEKIGREEVLSFSKVKETHVQNSAATDTGGNKNNLLLDRDIKKETDELPQNICTKEDKSKASKKPASPEYNNHSKSSVNENFSNQSQNSLLDDDDDNEIEFIGYRDSPITNKSPSHASSSSSRAEARNYDEESRSSPEMKSANSFTFPATARPWNESTVLKSQRGAEVTTALSERLQECINQVCADVGVLDRKKLDAFLIHVKKKSNPIRVALNYTGNTKGLKEQLQAVLHTYYNTPQTGTKEDIQFIKWLNGLVDRYDGSIPKKRKRSGKTEEERPYKR